ncbi:MAG: 3'(2'),5'-bisphosphate nucleotidase CysQ family protein [Methylocystis sp.]|uniref:3'(2'),5'-bisphosphate nucleotidase CysQ family protein n=1 Tax=Methylocystis sp. TaxID=1911079 RepID=UPI003DA27E74
MSHPHATPAERLRLSRLFGDLVAGAGALAMEALARPRIASHLKTDNSPVTEADERVEAFLLAAFARDLPGLPIIAEEQTARGDVPAHGDAFLLIDPIDGTREFLARSTEFTINVALVLDAAPIVGAVAAPAQGRVWFAGAESFVAEAAPGSALPAPQDWRRLRTRRPPPAGLTALVSKSHLDPQTLAFISRMPIAERMSVGSSLKFCAIAEGLADVYPRFGPTMEWDTAAGDAVLRAAGGVVLDPAGAPLLYNKAAAQYRNGPFVAWGDPAAATVS